MLILYTCLAMRLYNPTTVNETKQISKTKNNSKFWSSSIHSAVRVNQAWTDLMNK